MEIGRLRHRITIQKPGTVQDEGGGWVEGFETVRTIAANIKPMTAKQLMEAEQAQYDVTHKITIRYRTDVNRTQRITHKGRTFDIKTIVNQDEANRFLLLLCVERGR